MRYDSSSHSSVVCSTRLCQGGGFSSASASVRLTANEDMAHHESLNTQVWPFGRIEPQRLWLDEANAEFGRLGADILSNERCRIDVAVTVGLGRVDLLRCAPGIRVSHWVPELVPGYRSAMVRTLLPSFY